VLSVLAATRPPMVHVTELPTSLQFTVETMTPAAIASDLYTVVHSAGMVFEAPALALIGRSASGSMRDALSLLDQAIAYGGGSVLAASVSEMLGSVDQGWIDTVLDALAAGDGAALIGAADAIGEAGSPFERVIDELALRLHRVALTQAGVAVDDAHREACERHARQFAPEDVQVYYQIVIHGARDLALAPDPHAGFSMTLLRMLAFRPVTVAGSPNGPGPAPAGAGGGNPTAASTPPSASATGAQALQALRAATSSRPVRAAPPSAAVSASKSSPPVSVAEQASGTDRSPAAAESAASIEASPSAAESTASIDASPAAVEPAPNIEPYPAASGLQASFDGNWPAVARQLNASGLVGQFLQQSELLSVEPDCIRVRVPIRPLAEPGTVARVRERLAQHFVQPVRLQVEVGAVAGVTAARVAEQQRGERLEAARESLESDPLVQSLLSDLGGRILPDSVTPLGGGTP